MHWIGIECKDVLESSTLPDPWTEVVYEEEGTTFSAKKKYLQENLFFNGVYQVYKVESRFDNGQFLQTLFCVRMNNQQGQGSAPRILSSQVGAYTDLSAEIKIKEIDKKRALIEKRKADQDYFDLLFGK